ncbi:MAG: peptidylprolyl isomerase [Acidobacteriota bacterium]
MARQRIVVGLLISIGFWAAAQPTPPEPAQDVAVLSTPYGEIVWRFLPEAAPGHVAYVKELIGKGFYDGTTMHRVIPHFVVQGGDPNSKDSDRANDGEGQAERTLEAEFSPNLHYRPGTVGMARDTDPDSGSCQYFIAIDDIPRLDGKYTIFAEVVSGLDVARRIAQLPRDTNDNPLERVLVKARLEKRTLPHAIVSATAAAVSGETITGPDKPKPYDPKDGQWVAPTLQTKLAAQERKLRLDLSIAADGSVLDVRFTDPASTNVNEVLAAARAWRFTPATYAGAAAKVRIEIDSDGTGLGPPR